MDTNVFIIVRFSLMWKSHLRWYGEYQFTQNGMYFLIFKIKPIKQNSTNWNKSLKFNISVNYPNIYSKINFTTNKELKT